METGRSLFDSIDWRRPWLAPLRERGEVVAQATEWRSALNDAAEEGRLRNHRGFPIRFVAQAELPPDISYEAFISATGNVPTRDNPHDFFNALVWLAFPRIKAQLNALQAHEIEKSQARPDDMTCAGRGRVRDAATIFDENAALLITSADEMVEVLRAHHWHEAFVRRRAIFENECEVRLFGHALMEKLNAPYKAITAHAWPLVVEREFFSVPEHEKSAWIDAAVARQLLDGLTMSDFLPLPVFGVPGWWDGQDDEFYADVSVFRPRRRRPA